MKISAIEIRKHTFEKIFRGYDPDEVDAFLNSLSQEWERFSSENSLLKMQLEYAEKELSKLKDIESTLFRTLKAAEDTSKLIEKEAHELAEKRIEESKSTASDLVSEAESRTSQIIRETEDRLKQFKEDFATEIKRQERDFKAIENFRDNLIVQLTSLANNTIDTVERFEQKYDKESVLNKMEEIKQHVAEIDIPKKPTYQIPAMEVAREEEPEEHQAEVSVILQDDKPEVVFEIAKEEEEPEIVEVEPEEEELLPEAAFEQEELNAIEEPEPVAVTEPEPEPVEEEVVYNRPRETVRSAADEANEALAEMHRSAEKARDSSPAINRPRETTQPKKTGGGGSFFDQI
ncbi:DivIVA domain-containing protein [Dyadobacter sp. Leaf189]|uniref:DivIVA domain-containing protein n=1 Tax=Dyadobacter sp. Leaf189 TaxID=1736295 RepID=UPI0006F7D80B|nr:DivIVA domain-containing protein [Dyadobacter sp. Leaf189]KQS31402.1 cell division protein DivIVA [Dyadobacter sp. Leaf189]